MTIGERIAYARNVRGFTQRELAERIGMTQVNLCFIERGKRRPNLKFMMAFEDATGIPSAYLLFDPDKVDISRDIRRKRKAVAESLRVMMLACVERHAANDKHPVP